MSFQPAFIANLENKYGKNIIDILRSYDLELDLSMISLIAINHEVKDVRCNAFFYLVAKESLINLKQLNWPRYFFYYKNSDGWSAALIAISRGREDVLDWLLEEYNTILELYTKDHLDPVCIAILYKQEKMLNKLVPRTLKTILFSSPGVWYGGLIPNIGPLSNLIDMVVIKDDVNLFIRVREFVRVTGRFAKDEIDYFNTRIFLALIDFLPKKILIAYSKMLPPEGGTFDNIFRTIVNQTSRNYLHLKSEANLIKLASLAELFGEIAYGLMEHNRERANLIVEYASQLFVGGRSIALTKIYAPLVQIPQLSECYFEIFKNKEISDSYRKKIGWELANLIFVGHISLSSVRDSWRIGELSEATETAVVKQAISAFEYIHGNETMDAQLLRDGLDIVLSGYNRGNWNEKTRVWTVESLFSYLHYYLIRNQSLLSEPSFFNSLKSKLIDAQYETVTIVDDFVLYDPCRIFFIVNENYITAVRMINDKNLKVTIENKAECSNYLKLSNSQQRAIAALAYLYDDSSVCASFLHGFITNRIFSIKFSHLWKPEILLGYLEYYVYEKKMMKMLGEPSFLSALKGLLEIPDAKLQINNSSPSI